MATTPHMMVTTIGAATHSGDPRCLDHGKRYSPTNLNYTFKYRLCLFWTLPLHHHPTLSVGTLVLVLLERTARSQSSPTTSQVACHGSSPLLPPLHPNPQRLRPQEHCRGCSWSISGLHSEASRDPRRGGLEAAAMRGPPSLSVRPVRCTLTSPMHHTIHVVIIRFAFHPLSCSSLCSHIVLLLVAFQHHSPGWTCPCGSHSIGIRCPRTRSSLTLHHILLETCFRIRLSYCKFMPSAALNLRSLLPIFRLCG